MTPEVVAVITARGGSKSMPGKNIAPLAGRPILAWTVEAALACPMLDRVIVSTDDDEIARIGREWGAEVPFKRPAALAQDDSTTMDTMVHALEWLAAHENYQPDYAICLQPTSPLRTAADIKAVIDLAGQKDADAVFSMSPVVHHPYWTKQIDSEGRMTDFIPLEQPITRRQDLPPVYALNGAIYLHRRPVLVEQKQWYPERLFAYVMPYERSLDINTAFDFHLVDLMLRERGQHAND